MEIIIEVFDHADAMNALFCIRSLDTTIMSIILEFSKLIREKRPTFDPSQYNLYYIDLSNPFNTSAPINVTNYEQNLKDLKSTCPHFILSKEKIEEYSPCTDKSQNKNSGEDKYLEYEELLLQSRFAIELYDYEESLKCLELARKIDSQDKRSYEYEIALYIKTRKYSIAIDLSTQAISKFSQERSFYLLNAKALRKSLRFNDAIDVLRKVNTIKASEISDFDEISYNLGKCYQQIRHYDQAKMALKTIIAHNGKNQKAYYALAQTYFELGKFMKGILLITRKCMNDPDFQKLSKFISRHMVSQTLITQFCNELGDSMKDYNFVFFLAYTLYENGRFGLATPLFQKALVYQKQIPAISYGFLKNEIAQNPRTERISSIINIFKVAHDHVMNNSPLSSLFLPIITWDFNCKNEPYEPVPFRILEYEENVSSFSTDQLDVFAFFMTLQTFYFMNGHITNAAQISNALLPIVQPFNLYDTILEDEASLFIYVSSLIPSIRRPISNLKPFYVVGGKEILTLSWRIIQIGREKNMIHPVFINGLTIASLQPRSRSSIQKTMFYNQINSIPPNSTIMFVLGEESYDLAYYDKTISSTSTIEEYYEEISSSFGNIITKMYNTFNHRVLIHPAFTHDTEKGAEIESFNKAMSSTVDQLKATIPDCAFLDIIDQLIDPETKIVKKEFSMRSIMHPNYIRIVEKSINGIEMKNGTSNISHELIVPNLE